MELLLLRFYTSIKKKIQIYIPFLISVSILFYLYSKNDILRLFNLLEDSSKIILTIAASISILLGLAIAFRYSFFSFLLSIKPFPRYLTSIKSYFLASTVNVVLPSKLGDLSKGLICSRIDSIKYPISLHIFTLYEKISDLFSLIFLGLSFGSYYLFFNYRNEYIKNSFLLKSNIPLLILFALLIIFLFILQSPLHSRFIQHNYINNLPSKLLDIIKFSQSLSWGKYILFLATSLFIWLIHLFQICLFAYAIGMNIISFKYIFLVIISILVGLLPISFAGIGTRDAALLYFLAPYFGEEKCLLLGILLTSRYIIPAIFGLFFTYDLFRIRTSQQ